MDKPWTVEYYEDWIEARRSGENRKRKQYLDSYDRRDRLWETGATGYWTPGESRVAWPRAQCDDYSLSTSRGHVLEYLVLQGK